MRLRQVQRRRPAPPQLPPRRPPAPPLHLLPLRPQPLHQVTQVQSQSLPIRANRSVAVVMAIEIVRIHSTETHRQLVHVLRLHRVPQLLPPPAHTLRTLSPPLPRLDPLAAEHSPPLPHLQPLLSAVHLPFLVEAFCPLAVAIKTQTWPPIHFRPVAPLLLPPARRLLRSDWLRPLVDLQATQPWGVFVEDLLPAHVDPLHPPKLHPASPDQLHRLIRRLLLLLRPPLRWLPILVWPYVVLRSIVLEQLLRQAESHLVDVRHCVGEKKKRQQVRNHLNPNRMRLPPPRHPPHRPLTKIFETWTPIPRPLLPLTVPQATMKTLAIITLRPVVRLNHRQRRRRHRFPPKVRQQVLPLWTHVLRTIRCSAVDLDPICSEVEAVQQINRISNQSIDYLIVFFES